MSSWSWRSWQFLVYWSLTLKQLHLVLLIIALLLLYCCISWQVLTWMVLMSRTWKCNIQYLSTDLNKLWFRQYITIIDIKVKRPMKMTNKILSLLFRIFCVILFTVQVLNIMNEYGNQKPATIHSNERQEAYPRPLFCFSVNEFDNENFNTSANITSHWRIVDRRSIWEISVLCTSNEKSIFFSRNFVRQ